jgi:hypothetical protein
MSSIIYCGSGLFAFAKANNSGRNSFLSNAENGILCFVNRWQSKDERGALLPISKGQRLIVVHSGGCT